MSNVKFTAGSIATSILMSKENQISIIASLANASISEVTIKKVGEQIIEAYAAKDKDGETQAKNVCNQLRARKILPEAIKVTGEIFSENTPREGTKAAAYNAVVSAYIANEKCDVKTVVLARCPVMKDADAKAKELESVKEALSKIQQRLVDVGMKSQAAQLMKIQSTF